MVGFGMAVSFALLRFVRVTYCGSQAVPPLTRVGVRGRGLMAPGTEWVLGRVEKVDVDEGRIWMGMSVGAES